MPEHGLRIIPVRSHVADGIEHNFFIFHTGHGSSFLYVLIGSTGFKALLVETLYLETTSNLLRP
jgi:transketolase